MNDAVPRTQRHPPRFIMKSGSVWCVFTSTGLDTPRCGRKTASPGQPRSPGSQVFQFITGHRTGGVLGTYRVIFGSQYAPGRMPFTPQARPPFSAPARSRDRSQRHLSPDEHITMRQAKCFTRFGGQATPIISGIRPPARTSSISTSVFSRRLPAVRRFRGYALHLCTGNVNYVAHVQVRDVDFDWQCTASSIVLKKIGAILPPRHKPPRVCSAHVEYHRP